MPDLTQSYEEAKAKGLSRSRTLTVEQYEKFAGQVIAADKCLDHSGDDMEETELYVGIHG